jgi:hypothetical protein
VYRFCYWEIGCFRSHHIMSKIATTMKKITSPNRF